MRCTILSCLQKHLLEIWTRMRLTVTDSRGHKNAEYTWQQWIRIRELTMNVTLHNILSPFDIDYSAGARSSIVQIELS